VFKLDSTFDDKLKNYYCELDILKKLDYGTPEYKQQLIKLDNL